VYNYVYAYLDCFADLGGLTVEIYCDIAWRSNVNNFVPLSADSLVKLLSVDSLVS